NKQKKTFAVPKENPVCVKIDRSKKEEKYVVFSIMPNKNGWLIYNKKIGCFEIQIINTTCGGKHLIDKIVSNGKKQKQCFPFIPFETTNSVKKETKNSVFVICRQQQQQQKTLFLFLKI
ncbi:hypothetical protein DERF_001078, partial [Dermatophagoides farinae]